MGYDFGQAVADLVDNSIEAGARTISVDMDWDGEDSWVRIADDGDGMRPAELREALRFGSKRTYEDDDLGKFGLGLKTASISQCACLSVASRWNPKRADIVGYCWDLQHVNRTDSWEILQLEGAKLAAQAYAPLRSGPGTVVLWQKLDRIMAYQYPDGRAAEKGFASMLRDLESHLGMVFHRFLSGAVGRRRQIRILVNGNRVEPWDPFCTAEPGTEELPPKTVPVSEGETHGEIVLEPFVLPPQDNFSSPDAFSRAAGPNRWNQQQGFYVYRSDRLLQSGGWSHLRAPDEHTKLARIAVRFQPRLDDAFKVNIAKMRVQMPASARNSIRDAIGPAVALASKRYRRKPNTREDSPRGAHKGRRDDHDGKRLLFSEWMGLLLGAATPDERRLLEQVQHRVQQRLQTDHATTDA